MTYRDNSGALVVGDTFPLWTLAQGRRKGATEPLNGVHDPWAKLGSSSGAGDAVLSLQEKEPRHSMNFKHGHGCVSSDVVSIGMLSATTVPRS